MNLIKILMVDYLNNSDLEKKDELAFEIIKSNIKFNNVFLKWILNIIRTPSFLVGDWKLKDSDDSMGVGPNRYDVSWWSIGIARNTRNAQWDDIIRFNNDGSFNNIMNDSTWLEVWQTGSDMVGSPVYPHDGSVPATWTFNDNNNTLTLNGLGAHVGIPKAVNGAELPSVDVPPSRTYQVTYNSNNPNEIGFEIETYSGVWWSFKYVKVN